MIKAEIIADSKNLVGVRLTTVKLEYPRYIHSQLMTHRVMSRNASSSRAIPVKTLIERVGDNPVVPREWRFAKRGMNPGGLMNKMDSKLCHDIWMDTMYYMLDAASLLADHGAQKEVVNRLLEPFSHIQTLVSATDWKNFFSLRIHEDAQHEITELAIAIKKEMDKNEPKLLRFGEWHLPFIEPIETSLNLDTLVKISTARCARVSYLLHDGRKPDIESDLKLYERLVGSEPLHASPAEHPAMALTTDRRIRNFRGFRMHRDFIDHSSAER